MSLPLRIFEERYKLMIGECLEKNLPFGVVLIKEGLEVGGPAKPHQIGTTARITKAERQEEGRYALQTVGERRFKVHQITQETPFLMGRVEYLLDEGIGDPADVETKARELLGQYWRVLAGIKGGWVQEIEIPQDLLALSYAIAQSVARPPMVGQYLLQLPSAKERLERSIPLLQEQLVLVQKELEKRHPFQGPRLN